MKITAVKPYPTWVAHRNQRLLKIETDEGIYGWGESGLSGREKAVVGALEHYAPLLIGSDPFEIGAIWQELYRSTVGQHATGACMEFATRYQDIAGRTGVARHNH